MFVDVVIIQGEVLGPLSLPPPPWTLHDGSTAHLPSNVPRRTASLIEML